MRNRAILLIIPVLVLLSAFPLFSQTDSSQLEAKLKTASDTDKAPILRELMQVLKEESPEKSISYGREAYKIYKKNKKDVIAVETGLELGRILYKKKKYSECAQLYEDALFIAKNIEDRVLKARLHEQLAYTYRRLNNHEKALVNYQKIIDLLQNVSGYKVKIAEVNNRMGISYSRLSDYRNAINRFKEAVRLKKELNDSSGVANSLNNLGVAYWNIRDSERAIDYYFQSLKIKEDLGNKKGIASTCNNIGIIYRSMKEYDKALGYYQRSLDLKKELGIENDASISNNYNNIGVIFWKKKDYDKALEYYNKAYSMEKERNDKRSMARSLNNIAIIYKELKSYDLAIEKFNESLKYRRETKYGRGIATVLNNLGQIYYEIGRFDSVEPLINESMQIAQEINAKDLIRNDYGVFVDYYSAKGDFKNAFTSLRHHTALNDSINSEESKKLISELHIKYELEEKERQIDWLREKDEAQSQFITVLLTGLIAFFILLAVIYYLYRTNLRINRLLVSVIESLTYPFTVFDMLTGKNEVTNKAYTELRDSTIEHSPFSKRVEYDEISRLFAELIDTVKEKMQASIYESSITGADGSEQYFELHGFPIFDANGKLSKVIGYIIDVTDRKKAQNYIRESEEKFRSLAEQSFTGIIIMQENMVVYANDTFASLMEFSKDEIKNLNKNNIEKILTQATNKTDQLADENVQGAEERNIYELMTRNGSKKWIEKSEKTIQIGNSNAMMIMILDVTDRITAEKNIATLRRQYYRSERLAAIGRLSSSIAHEINNPLQAIIDNIDLVESELNNDFVEKESLNQVRIGIDRITNTVRQLLDLSRPKLQVLEKVDLHYIIDSTLNLLKNQLQRNKITIERNYSGNGSFIQAHRQEMFQVFMNVFLNSMEAMKKGGVLSISSEINDAKVSISINDNGEGIDEKVIDHIFEPFFTTKSDMLGTGLGLSIARGIINSFNGKIEVQSKKNEGTTFFIIFDLFKEKK